MGRTLTQAAPTSKLPASMMKLLAAICNSSELPVTKTRDQLTWLPSKLAVCLTAFCRRLTQLGQVELPRLAPYLLESSLNSQNVPQPLGLETCAIYSIHLRVFAEGNFGLITNSISKPGRRAQSVQFRLNRREFQCCSSYPDFGAARSQFEPVPSSFQSDTT